MLALDLADDVLVPLRQIADAILGAEDVALVTHVNPDGDAIGSLLGLTRAVRSLGKQCWSVDDDAMPWSLSYLPGIDDVVTWARVQRAGIPGLIVALDCSDLQRTALDGPEGRLFADVPLVQIDHHATNTRFGQTNCVDPTAASAGELVYALVRLLDVPIDADLATCLLTTLYTDTGSFQYSNTTPRTHCIAAALLAAGGRHVEIAYQAFRKKRFAIAKLWGLALGTLEQHVDGRVVGAFVTLDMQRKCGIVDEGTEGLVEYMAGIDGSDVVFLLREASDGSIKVSFRSSAAVDVAQVAFALGGGGHPRAAGCSLPGPLDAVRDRILAVSLAVVA